LAITGAVAWLVAQNKEWLERSLAPGMRIGLFIATIILAMVIGGATRRIGPGLATVLFIVFAAMMGLSLAVIFVLYTSASITAAFMTTAGTFAVTSIYGFVTKRDLSRLGSLLMMALFGLIIASVVNIFWANSTLYWLVTYAGVLIFVGLTAYDTQKLKHIALQTANDARMASRLAITGALDLYLDFINLFLLLLRILGKGRN
jgi:FtsH-binding integral membrane protein